MKFFFPFFFIEIDLFTENVIKGLRGYEPSGWTVQLTQLILISIEVEFLALQSYKEFFFELIFIFRVTHFFQKSFFFPKKLKFQTA